MLKIKITSALLAFVWLSSMAQYSIRGTVNESVTGFPLIGASIVIVDSEPLKGATADLNGDFAIEGLAPGRYTLTASAMGYETQTIQQVMLSAGKELILNFKLVENVTRLKEIEVRGNSNKTQAINDMALISTRSFSIEETERFAGSLGDPARMVANFAGVIVNNDSRNDIVIRGNSPMGLLWRLEGVEVPNPNHFGAQGTTGGPVSMLNSNLLANSDFMTGAFAAEYGNALSGVFDLNLRSGNKQNYEFTGQVGFNGFELAAEGPLRIGKLVKNGSFLIDYRYSTLDLMSKLGLNIGTGTAVPEYQDFTAIIDLPTAKAGRFKIVGLWGKSFIQLGRSFEVDENTAHNQLGYATDFGAGLALGMLTHTFMPNEKIRFKSTLSYQHSSSVTQNDSIDFANKAYIQNYAGKLNEDKLSFTTQMRYKFDAKNNISIGLNVHRYFSSFNDSVWAATWQKHIVLSGVDRKPSTLYQTYANWQHRFSESLRLNTGLHAQLHDLSSKKAIEPRMALQWKMSSKHAVQLGWGMHSQLQPRSVYFNKQYNRDSDTYSENNLGLDFSKAIHYNAGYDYVLNNLFRLKAEIYYQHLYNIPVSSNIKEFSMLNAGSGYFISEPGSLKNEGLGQNYGVELTLEKFMSKGYYALMTVSVYDSKYTAYDKIWRNTAFNSNFAFNLLGGYEHKVGKNNYITFDVRTVWAGGMRFIPIDLEASIAEKRQIMDNSKSYENRYADYFRTDLRIGFKTNKGKISQEWALDLQNVSNHKNHFSEQYNSATESISQIYQQGFMPMMLYRINF